MKRFGAKPITLNDALKKSVAAALRPYDIEFAYLFGSATTSNMHDESDIDIALFFQSTLSADVRHQQLLGAYGALANALNVAEEALDITVLNRSRTLIQYVAISEGVVLYEKNHEARVEFELAVMRQRDDEQFYRRESVDTFLNRLAQGLII